MTSPSRLSRSPLHGVPGVLFSMCLCLVLVIASVSALNLALPDLATDLDASTRELTWIADGYTVALAAFVLPLGAVGDRWGRRRVLLLGCLVFGVAAWMGAGSETPETLIAWRVAMGIGAAMIMPGTLSTITSAFPEEKRQMGVAMWSGFAAAGAVLGLLAAGWLLEHWSWDAIFRTSAVTALVAAAAAVVLAPETRDEGSRPVDVLGSLALAVGIGGLVFGIIEGSDEGWTRPAVMGAFVLCSLGFLLYTVHGLRAMHPILDPRLFRKAGFTAGTLTILVQFMAVFGFFYVGLQYLQLVLDWSALKSAVALLPVAAVVLPTAQSTPWLVRRTGARAVTFAGLALLSGALFWLTTLDVSSGYPPFLGGLLAAGLGIGLTSTTGTTMIVSALSRNEQGVASAMNDTTREVGSAIGIALMGAVFDAHYSQSLPDLSRLPRAASDAAQSSAPAGLKAAEALGGPAGGLLRTGVQDAFMEGFTASLGVVAFILAAVALVVLVLAPGRTGAGRHSTGRTYRGEHIESRRNKHEAC